MKTKVFLSVSLGIAAIFLHCSVTVAGATNQTTYLDLSFDPGSGAAGGLVETVVPQPDGKVLICGNFGSINGVAQPYIARLDSQGAVDTQFHSQPGYWVRHMALQPDGKIIIGGFFTNVEGVPRNRVARLNSDGSLDTSFNPGTGADKKIVEGDDKDPFVFATAVQKDGKILIGGNFAIYNGQPSSGLARLNPDGSLDPTFSVGAGANSWVRSLYLLDNGQILVSGWFTTFNNQTFNRMVRLNADGSPDPSFYADFGDSTAVYTMAVQPDGKILVGGHFSRVNSTPRNSIARINPDGSADETFDPGTGPDGFVECIRLQPDGRAVLAGYFSQINGVPRFRTARLNADGSVDESYKADLDNFAWTVAIQSDGKFLFSGGFSTVDGISRNEIARVLPGGTGFVVPRLLDPALQRGQFTAWVATVPGMQYLLQHREVNSDHWLDSPSVTGDGSMKALVDTTASSSSSRIYRVIVN